MPNNNYLVQNAILLFNTAAMSDKLI